MTRERATSQRNTRGAAPDAKPALPWGHGYILCTCGNRSKACECHPEAVRYRVKACPKCSMSKSEMAAAAKEAADAIATGKPIPRRVATIAEGERSAAQALDEDFDDRRFR